MSRFWDFVSKTNAANGQLPLIHATDLFCFRKIKDEEILRPSGCDVYDGENLLYFFYGRPSYRPHAQLDTVNAKALLPVCLVMSRALTKQAVRIMPFDTGAFHSGKMMHPPMHRKMKLEEFELVADANTPMQLISLFYGSERQYYDARPQHAVGGYDEFEDLEIDSYARLLNHRANTEFDDRVTAIEIQLKTPVDLTGQVRAAILPAPYLDRPGVAQQVEGWGGVAIPYNVKEEFIPKEIQGAIFDRLTEFFEQEGILQQR